MKEEEIFTLRWGCPTDTSEKAEGSQRRPPLTSSQEASREDAEEETESLDVTDRGTK